MPTNTAIAAAQATARRLAGGTVTLVRDGAEAADVPVAIGTTQYDLVDGNGVVSRFESRDFLIAVGDYDFGGGPVRPKRGDQIVEVVAGTTFTYEVSAPNGQNDWRFNGPYRDTYRVHTKKISETP